MAHSHILPQLSIWTIGSMDMNKNKIYPQLGRFVRVRVKNQSGQKNVFLRLLSFENANAKLQQ